MSRCTNGAPLVARANSMTTITTKVPNYKNNTFAKYVKRIKVYTKETIRV